MRTELKHILSLISVITLTYIISRINLTSYDVPIALGFFIILFLAKKISLPSGGHWNIIESCLFTFIIMFTVFTTGGGSSPFFFLVFFLVFSISLLLEPQVSLSITLFITLLLVFTAPADTNIKTMLPIFSLAFLAPFAMTLSQERIEIERLKKKEQTEEENNLLFLSLTIKKHITSISDMVENFKDVKDLEAIKNQTKIIKKLIDRYEADYE